MSQALPFPDSRDSRETHPSDSPAHENGTFSYLEPGSATDDGTPHSMRLELHLDDQETIRALEAFSNPRERSEFARQAIKIGVLSLKQARGEIDSLKIRHESERLLETLDEKLNQHSRGLNERMTATLKDYFDPQSGRFQERIDRLIKKDGDLERLLRQQVGANDSELSKVLTSHVGSGSELMQMLSPDQSKGLMSAIRDTLDGQLKHQRDHVIGQFSLDNKEGALSRLIKELTDNHGQLSDKLSGKIDEVVKEFSLDSEESALSRLVRNVDRAQRTITNEFSLDEDGSALSRLKRMMEDTNSTLHSHLSLDDDQSALARLRKELFGLLKTHADKSLIFQEEVKGSLNAMIVKRDERNKSTRHGNDFEAALCEYLFQEAQAAGDFAVPTGNSVGQIKGCKKVTVSSNWGRENVSAGAKLVVEAKEDDSYTIAKARAELEIAKKNRDASVGVFVFSSKTAPEGMEPFTRYGEDVFIVWDAEQPNSDLFLKAGMTLARALCVRASGVDAQEAVDFAAIDKAVLEIEKRTEMLGDIQTWSSTIINNGEKIQKRVDTSRKSLEKQLELLRSKVSHLKEIV